MRIACDACNAAYDVPAERVPPGRSVRCARCGKTWTPVALVDAEPPISPVLIEPPAAAAPQEPVLSPVPEPVPVAPLATIVAAPEDMSPLIPPAGTEAVASELPAPARSRIPVLLGWIVTFGLLAALGWAAVTQRPAITRAWPASERLYQWAGVR